MQIEDEPVGGISPFLDRVGSIPKIEENVPHADVEIPHSSLLVDIGEENVPHTDVDIPHSSFFVDTRDTKSS